MVGADGGKGEYGSNAPDLAVSEGVVAGAVVLMAGAEVASHSACMRGM